MDEEDELQRGPQIERMPACSSRTWRACCLAPAIAVGVVLILTVMAGLFGPQPRQPQTRPPDVSVEDTRRDVFIQFGKQYFAIAHRADTLNEAAFAQLEAFRRGDSSIGDARAAFRKAAEANARASAEFKRLSVPAALSSQSKLRQSLDTMSEAYDARRRACEIIAGWNGDLNDRTTLERYRQQVVEINRLTVEGLRRLGEASRDNGLTRDDSREFLPAAAVPKAGESAQIFRDLPRDN